MVKLLIVGPCLLLRVPDTRDGRNSFRGMADVRRCLSRETGKWPQRRQVAQAGTKESSRIPLRHLSKSGHLTPNYRSSNICNGGSEVRLPLFLLALHSQSTGTSRLTHELGSRPDGAGMGAGWGRDGPDGATRLGSEAANEADEGCRKSLIWIVPSGGFVSLSYAGNRQLQGGLPGRSEMYCRVFIARVNPLTTYCCRDERTHANH